MKVLLLTQETGTFLPDGTVEGNRSCALMEREHLLRQNQFEQFQIRDCQILGGAFYVNGRHIKDLETYDALVVRTWGDEAQSNHAINNLLPYFESKGLFPDNPVRAIMTSKNKLTMQHAIESANACCPLTFSYDSNTREQYLTAALTQLEQKFIEKKIDPSHYPAFVIKSESGTHGNGVVMFCLNEKDRLRQAIAQQIKEGGRGILQEYIKPKYDTDIGFAHQPCSSHYRIIMSRQVNDQFLVIGGMHLQRVGSWISNTHCRVGRLIKAGIDQTHFPDGLLSALTEVANSIGLNQFGADVIIDDQGAFYILELNDGMGISGEILESQEVPRHYVESHISRCRQSMLYKNSSAAEALITSVAFFSQRHPTASLIQEYRNTSHASLKSSENEMPQEKLLKR